MKTKADYIDPEAIENCETCGGLGHVVGTDEDGIRVFYTCEGCEAPVVTQEALRLRRECAELRVRSNTMEPEITCTFYVSDIEDLFGWSTEKASKFLDDNRKQIAESMIRAGWTAIESLEV